MGLHPSHVTRFSMDASTYDEVCINCGATDRVPGGWGELAEPCPATKKEDEKMPKVTDEEAHEIQKNVERATMSSTPVSPMERQSSLCSHPHCEMTPVPGEGLCQEHYQEWLSLRVDTILKNGEPGFVAKEDVQCLSANARQVGGTHYHNDGTELQHWDVVYIFGLDYFQGQVTKYVMRWRKKGGVQDLKKARHFLDKYIELAEAEQQFQNELNTQKG